MLDIPADLTLFAVLVAGFFGIGLPLITSRISLPRRVEFETVADASLTPQQSACFAPLDGQLSELGYRPAGNWRPTNMQGRALLRLYLSEADPAVILMNLLTSEVPGGDEQGMNYLEITTRYRDGSMLTTRNAEISDVLARLPEHTIRERRGLRDPGRLKRDHDLASEPHRVREPVFVRGDEFEASFHEFHEQWCAHQEACGLLRAVEDGRLRPTVRAGLRGIFNYLNPLADNFTPLRFALVLVLGLLVPAAGILWLGGPGAAAVSELAARTGVDAAVWRIGGLGVALMVSGIVIGTLFVSKSFIWSFLLTYVLLRLTGVVAFWPTLGLSVWSAMVADMVARRRVRGDRLA
jgi:hypothetical protein